MLDRQYDPSAANGAAEQERRSASSQQPLAQWPPHSEFSRITAWLATPPVSPWVLVNVLREAQPRAAVRRGVLDVFNNVCERWQVTYPEQIVLLGYKGAERLGAHTRRQWA